MDSQRSRGAPARTTGAALSPRVAIGAAIAPGAAPTVRAVPCNPSPVGRPRALLLSLEAPALLRVELTTEPTALASLFLQLQGASSKGRRAAVAGFLLDVAGRTCYPPSLPQRELLGAVGAKLAPELAAIARAVVRGTRCYGRGFAAVRGRIVPTASAGVGSGRRWRPLLLGEA